MLYSTTEEKQAVIHNAEAEETNMHVVRRHVQI